MRKINSDESGEESRNTPSPVFKGGRGTEKKGEITKPTSGEEEAERDSTACNRQRELRWNLDHNIAHENDNSSRKTRAEEVQTVPCIRLG